MHNTWIKHQGCLSSACMGLQQALWCRLSVIFSISLNVWQTLLLVFTTRYIPTIQCISINVKSCVFTRSVWPLIFIQPNSTLPNHSLLQNYGPRYVNSHWTHFTTSPGTGYIAFHFPSNTGKGLAQINPDILQCCLRCACCSCLIHFQCLICIHSTTVCVIKGLSHVWQISIWIPARFGQANLYAVPTQPLSDQGLTILTQYTVAWTRYWVREWVN